MPDQMALFQLTDTEWRHRSKKLAALVCEYTRVEEHKNQTAKAFGDTLKALRQQMHKLSEAVVQEREWRARRTPTAEHAGEILDQEEELAEALATEDDDDIRVICQHCRAEFRNFAGYVQHRREVHPVA